MAAAAVAAAAATTQTVHASFSSDDAMDMSAVQNAVNNAGFRWSTHHQGQQENWFDVWSEKAEKAAYVVVIFSKGYRGRFTRPLKQEADCIQRLHDQGTPVYVFNSEGERGHRAAEVEVNLRQAAKHMGNYTEWQTFVNTTEPRDPVQTAAAATATPPQPQRPAAHMPAPVPTKASDERTRTTLLGMAVVALAVAAALAMAIQRRRA